YVEGPTDVTGYGWLSAALNETDPDIPNLMTDPRVAFIVTGGDTLKHWVNERYLKGLNRPEVHLYDGDKREQQATVDLVNEVNGRGDGSWAAFCQKRELENYLHSDAIREGIGIEIEMFDDLNPEGDSVPKAVGRAYSELKGFDGVMKASNAK